MPRRFILTLALYPKPNSNSNPNPNPNPNPNSDSDSDPDPNPRCSLLRSYCFIDWRKYARRGSRRTTMWRRGQI